MAALSWLAAGLLLPLLLTSLPGAGFLFWILPVCLLACLVCVKIRWLLFGAGLLWTLLHLYGGLDQRLSEIPDSVVNATGRVSSLPLVREDMLEFRFDVEHTVPPGHLQNRNLLVRWYRDWPALRAGEKWRLSLNLKPARSRINFNGPDRERWYFAQSIAALAIVEAHGSYRIAESPGWSVLGFKQTTRDAIVDTLDDHPARPLILALSLADRSEIPNRQWAQFRKTGTSHLLAISGMHIGLAAMLGFYLGRLALIVVPLRSALRHGQSICCGFSIGLAGVYGMLAGLGTSTRRAMLMLLAFALVYLCRRNTWAWQPYLLALVAVLLFNPLAPLEAGFWLSFLAVAVLVAIFSTRHGGRGWLGSMLLAQAGIAAVMIPVSMFWFQQFTLLGFLSNLMAIPWISFGVVPPALLAIISLPLDSWLTPFLFYASAESAYWLLNFLDRLESIGEVAWFTTWRPGMTATLLATLSGFGLLLPHAFRFRYLGLTLLFPLALADKRGEGQLRIEMLDVGQGLAVMAETRRHLLLYDSGPGDGYSWSLVPSAVVPAVTASSKSAPDIIVISHGDLDHAGGIHELRKHYPGVRIISSSGLQGQEMTDCLAPGGWAWDGVRFDILHPRMGLPYLGNDSSCVLSIAAAGQRILLTGDISAPVEQRLVGEGLESHQVLFVPHHGSKSSSGAAFLEALKPEFALVSAGFRNRFDFPHPLVTGRFDRQGIPVWNSADCGGVEILFQAGLAPVARSARRHRAAIWRWAPEADCP